MTSAKTSSSSNTDLSEMDKHKRARFALLARVGRQKKEVSQLQDEASFYSTVATVLLAHSLEQLELLEQQAQENPALLGNLVTLESELQFLVKNMLRFWPEHTASQERFSKLLDSEPFRKVTDCTEDGYVSLSMERVLKNVGRAIVAS